MTITHLEIRGSRDGTDAKDRSSRAELVWHVMGTEDHAAALLYLRNNGVLGFWYDGLKYKSVSWESLGENLIEVRALYQETDVTDARAKLETGSYDFSFDTSGGTTTRTYAINSTRYAPSGKTASNFKGAINYDGENVNGVEITIPALKFSVRKRQPKGQITEAYVKLLASVTGTVNSDTFLGFAPGELLFLGASGSQGTDSDPEITYNFLASQNVTGLTIGDITGIAKKGHEYLWVYYARYEDTASKRTIKIPLSVHVDQVYQTTLFSQLAI